MRERSWRVIVGKPHLKNAIEADSLNMNAGNQSLHFVPTVAVAGGQSRSAGKIIVGVILIGAALVLAPMTGGFSAGMAAYAIGGSTMGLTFGNIVMLGASMILAGASALMTQGPNDGASPEDKARPDDRPSFIFNGIVNNTQQGSPVPLVYGEHLVGSIVVNASINSEDIYL
jgi:predicted phage tail protein